MNTAAETSAPELIVRADETAPYPGEVEIVERKGIGHPDTICDALAEEICRALCRAYLDAFGQILHHNVDKILLCGGAARPAFGGGEVLEPVELYLAGRATEEFEGRRVPVADIATEASRRWLRENIPALDADRDVRIIPKFRPGSGALRALFSKGKATALSNDTSCGAGFAPLTPLERGVLEVEKALNSSEVKRLHPALGCDVKVMGVRHGSRIRLTVSSAMIGRHLAGVADYVRAKDAVRQISLSAAKAIANSEIEVAVNAADDAEKGEIFLTVTGTSAESGDDGEAGRGNRVSGLITPYRPMTLEAAAGKNPVSHVGKLYNLAASRICDKIFVAIPGVEDASCLMASQIGRPVNRPQMVDLRIRPKPGARVATMIPAATKLILGELEDLGALQAELLSGRVNVY